MIIIKKTSENGMDLTSLQHLHKESIYVDMHFKGESNDAPLFSDSFANCLGIIVHDEAKKRGCLLHVFPVLAGANNPYTLFYFIDNEIEKIIEDYDHSTELHLFLWKGFSYTPAAINELTLSYADYAKDKFNGRFLSITDHMDKKRFSPESKILYNPARGEVFIIATLHSEDFTHATLREKSSNALAEWSPQHLETLAESDKTIEEVYHRLRKIIGHEPEIIHHSASIHTSSSSPLFFASDEDFWAVSDSDTEELSSEEEEEDHEYTPPVSLTLLKNG